MRKNFLTMNAAHFCSLMGFYMKAHAFTLHNKMGCKHHHLLEVVRALKFQGFILDSYWGDCFFTVAYLINRMPTQILAGKSPFELLYGKKPAVDHLRVFSCLCYTTTVGPRDKMSPRARRCVFMGYPNLQKGYRVLDLLTCDFLVSRDIIFHEDIFPFQETKEDLTASNNSPSFLHQEDVSPTYFLTGSLDPVIPSPSASTPPNQLQLEEAMENMPATQLNMGNISDVSTTTNIEESSSSSPQILHVVRDEPHDHRPGQRIISVHLLICQVSTIKYPHMSLLISFRPSIDVALVAYPMKGNPLVMMRHPEILGGNRPWQQNYRH